MLIVMILAVSTAFVAQERQQATEALKKANAIALLSRDALDEMYGAFANDWNEQPVELSQGQKRFLEKATRHYEQLIDNAPDHGDSFAAVKSLHQLAAIYNLMGDDGVGQRIAQRAVDIGESLLAHDSENVEKQIALAESIAILVRCSDPIAQGNTALRTRSAELWQKVVSAKPDDLRSRAKLAHAWAGLANAHHSLRQYPQTDMWIERAYQAISELVAHNPDEAWLKFYLREVIHEFATTRLDIELGNRSTTGVRPGQRELGQKLLQEGIELVRPLYEESPNDRGRQIMMAMALMNTDWFFDGPQTIESWTISVPNSAVWDAVLGKSITAPRTVTADVPITLAKLDFNNTNTYTIAGSNAVTFDAKSGDAQINVIQGSHTINMPVVLADNAVITITPVASNLAITGPLSAAGKSLTKTGAGTLTLNNFRAQALSINAGTVAVARNTGAPELGTSVVRTLTIAGDSTPTARLDLTDNAAVIDYTGTSPITTVRQQILSGRGGAGLGKTWNGNGITSSASATANGAEPESYSVGYAENSSLPLGPYTTFRSEPVDDTSILITYTRTGDANLDGVVNDDDVTIVGATYAPGVLQPHWALGDFDYNGFVDDDDVTLLGAFYDPSAPPLAAPTAESAVSAAAVPEPGTSVLLASALFSVALFAVRRCLLSRSEST